MTCLGPRCDVKIGSDIASGHHARKQLGSSARLIAWSHRRRLELALRLAGRLRSRLVLDFGCGDGTFLALLADSSHSQELAIGAEIDSAVVADCQNRLGARANLRFVHVDLLETLPGAGQFDSVFCMEVLEHLVEPESILSRLHSLLAPGGALVVSVPNEIGIPVLVKQAVRTVAGWRGIGDYPGVTPYSWADYWKSLFATSRQHLPRPVHFSPRGPSHDHKGFNWKILGETIRKYVRIEEVLGSPLGWLPVALASQVWFVARKLERP